MQSLTDSAPELAEIIRKQDAWISRIQQSREPSIEAARVAIAGCKNAIEQVQANLRSLDYPIHALTRPSDAGLESRLAKISSQTGIRFPITLKLFWELIGGIQFADIRSYSHVEFWAERQVEGSSQTTDAIFVESCDDDWEQFTIGSIEAWADGDATRKVDDTFLIPLAPDSNHKDDISGGDPYGVYSCSEFSPEWIWPGWVGAQPESGRPKLDLVGYLRTAILECGGFPGLYGVEEFEPYRQRILRGVPIF